MSYGCQLRLMSRWIPQTLFEWLTESAPIIDFVVREETWRGNPVLCVNIKSSAAEDVWAKREALNAMIEARGYGPRLTPRHGGN